MKLKLDANGNVVLQDGKPVYINEDGSEIAFDASQAFDTAKALRLEAKGHREGKEAAETKLKAFAGIEDPTKAIKAMQYADSMNGKTAMDDEAIQKLITAANKPLLERIAANEATIAEKDGFIYKEKVSNRFASSTFLKDKTILIPDIAEAYFGKNMKFENGKFVAVDAKGETIFSKVRAGETADFDEAIEILVGSHPQKDSLLKSSGASGSGAQGSQGSGKGDPVPTTSVGKIRAGLIAAGAQA